MFNRRRGRFGAAEGHAKEDRGGDWSGTEEFRERRIRKRDKEKREMRVLKRTQIYTPYLH